MIYMWVKLRASLFKKAVKNNIKNLVISGLEGYKSTKGSYTDITRGEKCLS